MAVPEHQLTEDGNEMHFQTNHLGHFLLTYYLIDLLPESGRIVIVSGVSHKIVDKLNFKDLSYHKREYDYSLAYAESKLMNLLFLRELARRLENKGSRIKVIGAHPGWCWTDIAIPAKEALFTGFLFDFGAKIFAQDAESGSQSQLRAATDPDVNNGEYYN